MLFCKCCFVLFPNSHYLSLTLCILPPLAVIWCCATCFAKLKSSLSVCLCLEPVRPLTTTKTRRKHTPKCDIALMRSSKSTLKSGTTTNIGRSKLASPGGGRTFLNNKSHTNHYPVPCNSNEWVMWTLVIIGCIASDTAKIYKVKKKNERKSYHEKSHGQSPRHHSFRWPRIPSNGPVWVYRRLHRWVGGAVNAASNRIHRVRQMIRHKRFNVVYGKSSWLRWNLVVLFYV